MKYIFLLFVTGMTLFANVIESPLLSVNKEQTQASIKIDKIDVGMSGFIFHRLSPKHTSILKNAVVSGYDKDTKIATLALSEFDGLKNNALPEGKWEVRPGDIAVLAFGYSRALLISPDEEIYYKITKNTKNIQWIHPDLFATILSNNGHPTPLKSDFYEMCSATSVGIVFFYLQENVFTLDCRSFKILNISKAPLKQTSEELPFYTRVQHIDEAWWGEGSDPLTSYEPHYYKLMLEFNKDNSNLLDIVKNSKIEAVKDLLKDADTGDKI